MAIYYLSARPETVVSIVRKGELPHSIPNYVKLRQLICFSDYVSCVHASQTSRQQTFVLVLKVPFQSLEKTHHSFLLEYVESDWIQKIIVASEKARLLLARLFKNDCPKTISVEKDHFITQQPSLLKEHSGEKRKHEKEEKKLTLNASNSVENAEPLRKKTKTHSTQSQAESDVTCSASSGLTIFSQTSLDEEMSDVYFQRLSTQDEHLDLLIHALKTARRTLLITSYDVNAYTLDSANLYLHFREARRRRIKIYIYCNDQKDIDEEIESFFESEGIFFAQLHIHSKIIAIDKSLVAVGSFNWLSDVVPHYSPSSQGTLVFRGEICIPFIEEFWKHIKNYRNEQFGNFRNVNRFESDFDNMLALCCPIETTDCLGRPTQSNIVYLATLPAHRIYIRDKFQSAQQRIIVCSPFISSTATFADDLDPQLLSTTISRGVKIIFICLSDNPCIEDFKVYLKSISPDILLLDIKGFHHKTVIVDDREIAEGSFNWLSAVRDRESEYHNHEATMVFEGEAAKPLINEFFAHPVGSTLLQYSQTNDLLDELFHGSSQENNQSSIFSTPSTFFGSQNESRDEMANSSHSQSSTL